MSAKVQDTDFDIFGNGPIHAGLVTGNDAFNPNKEGVHVHADGTRKSTVHTFGQDIDKLTSNMRLVVHAAVVLFMKVRSLNPRILTPGADGKEKASVAADPDNFIKDAKISASDAMRLAVSIVCATKVNWWMTNHHTGGNKVQGYVAKLLNSTGELTGYSTATPDACHTFEHAIWRIGHWFDTRVVLAAMGIADIEANASAIKEFKELVTPAADLLLRIGAPPAGTAKIFDCVAALRMLAGSPYTLVISKPGDIVTILSAAQAVRASPAHFHEGALYLTGKQRQQITQPENDTIETLGVFLHCTRAGHTLKKAACFANITADSNKTLAQAINGVSRAIADSNANKDDVATALKTTGMWQLPSISHSSSGAASGFTY